LKIDAKLNLVIPILDDEEKPIAYVHSMPIARETFERYFIVISKAFSAIYGEGLSFVAGPRVAALILRKIAEEIGEWEGIEGVKDGLLGEVRRLSSFIGPASNGWEPIPLEEAVRKGLISSDDLAEVENAIAFFIVASAMHKRNALKATLDGAAKLWGARVTSLNSTEFGAFLKTSTADENTGATAVVSSVPY